MRKVTWQDYTVEANTMHSYRYLRFSVWRLLIGALYLTSIPFTEGATMWTVGEATRVYDLVDAFDAGTVNNALAASASQQEVSGGQVVPGIFLHPLSEGEATWRFSLDLPATRPDEKLIFLGLVGLRDGIPWNDPSKPRCNGVDFRVKIGSITCISTTVTGPGWNPVQADLTPFQGQKVEMVMITSARGNPNYDWAVFGRPEILRLFNRRSVTREKQTPNGLRFPTAMDTSGIIIAEAIEPATPTLISVSRKGFTLTSGIPAKGTERGWIVRRFVTSPGDKTTEVVRLADLPDQCEVYHFTPTLKIKEFAPITALPLIGNNVFGIRIRNEGPGYYHPNGEPLEIQVIRKDTPNSSAWTVTKKFVTEGLPEIAPGESIVLRRGPFDIEPHVTTLRVALPKHSTSADFVSSFYPQPKPGAASLSCGGYRISFPKLADSYPAAIIESKDAQSGQFRSMGTIYPLTSAVVKSNGGLNTRNLIRDSIDWIGERELIISGTFTVNGKILKQSVRFTSDPDSSLTQFSSRLEIAEGEVEVYHFSGPRVAFGDGSFGAKHGYALFPGLEYLGPGDHSSSLLDAANPIAQRGAPDPIKITIPLTAVEYGNDLACMFWDPYQEWQSGHKIPGAQFNVPPADDMDEYSSFSLYAPPPPEWRSENAKVASKPVKLTPAHPITLIGAIYLEHADDANRLKATQQPKKGEFILTALRKYVSSFGFPDPMKQPRDWKTEKALSREAWFSTIWAPEEHGWRHAVGQSWRPAPAPGPATLLLFDYFDTPDPAIRKRLKERIQEAMKKAMTTRGPGYLSSGDNCHILRGEYPFYDGYLQEALEEWMAAGASLIQTQRKDGSWGWRPGNDPRRQNLGEPNQTTNGICAGSSYFLLKLGRVIGDDRFVQAGLKGIEALEQNRVPRGAQGWECPLHTPDILASAYAVQANVEAYRATSNEQYLDQARYWAWSGMPFVYLWNMDAIPSMRYNTIPIFGATFFTHSWFGRPVVWCGLVYAYALQQLDDIDTQFDWTPIAKGITVSGMWQQYGLDHKSKGCYPDSFDLRLNRRNPVDINPEDIMVNALTLRGLDPGIKTLKFNREGRAMTVSSGARIEGLTGTQGLSLKLSFFQGETTNTLITPVANVSHVWVGNREIPRVEILENVGEGYRIAKNHQWLIVKNKFDQPAIELRVSM